MGGTQVGEQRVVYDVWMSLSRPDRWPYLPVYRFYRLHVCLRCMSLCVAPHISPPIDPLSSPPPQTECQWVSSARLWWGMSLCLPPPETEIVTEFTGHRMHDTSHSIKVDFNGSDLFYSTDNQFTFTLNFTVHFTFIKLHWSRIWKCNHKCHCFSLEKRFLFPDSLLAELYKFSLVILSGVNLQNLKLNKSANFIQKNNFIKNGSLWNINQCSG